MEYKQFKEALIKELRKSFPDYEVEEKFEDSISIRVPGSRIAPAYRVKAIYEEEKEVTEKLMDGLIKNIEEAIENVPDIDTKKFMDFEKSKKNLIVVLMPAHKVRENAVQSRLTDGISIVVRVNLEIGTVLCTKEICNGRGVTEEEVIEAAKSNIKGKYAGTIEDLLQVVKEMMGGIDIDAFIGAEDKDPIDRQYVVRTIYENFGASAILQRGVQKELENIFGSKFVLLPSSIHEVIAFKYDEELMDTYREMLESANDESVREEDFLSNNVLIYENGEIREV